MDWRLGVAGFFLMVLLVCVLILAIQVTPATRSLPGTDLPPGLQAPLHGQIPDTMLYWTKLPWGEVTQVSPKTPKYPVLDASGTVLFPFD